MSSLNIFAELFQMVWPLLAVFGLVVSLRAKQRHPGSGSSLMVAGSAMGLLMSLAHATLNAGLRYDWFDHGNISMFYSFSNLLSILGQVLFLTGLLALINSIVTVEEAPMNRF